MKDKKSVGPDLCDALAIVFIVLKFIDVIEWRWLWVLSPIWIPIVISLVLSVIIAILD